ncbi:hypothetical protein [Zavarzinella formosa]|uniref:hypothetical protein n=1 Tax=Zavarzinella formosa TaxID=360055 RepID=UPI0002E4770F|nr:hypothetical protein [Zavarzinella formosa]
MRFLNALLFAIMISLSAISSGFAGDMKQEIQSERVDYILNAAFARYGYDPYRTIGLDRNSVRLKIKKAPKDSTQAGIYSHFTLAGDFELLADYDAIDLAKPATGYGMSLGIAVHTNGPLGAVFLSRSHHADWSSCLIVTRELPGEPEKKYEAEPFSTSAKKGRLGIRRTGKELILLAAENKGELKELKRIPFGADPINQIRFYCDTGGAELPIDGRFSSIVVRADAINGAAFPPDTRWPWTKWLLVFSLPVFLAGLVLLILKRRRNRHENS